MNLEHKVTAKTTELVWTAGSDPCEPDYVTFLVNIGGSLQMAGDYLMV